MANVEGRAIAFPFSLSSNGGISYVDNDDSTIYRDRIRFVVFTQFEERVMRPDFGSDIQSLVFEDAFFSESVAKRMLNLAFIKWLPNVTINQIIVNIDYSDLNGGLNIEIDYTLPNGSREATQLKTATYNRYGDIVKGG